MMAAQKNWCVHAEWFNDDWRQERYVDVDGRAFVIVRFEALREWRIYLFDGLHLVGIVRYDLRRIETPGDEMLVRRIVARAGLGETK
jgi:hypothetical protein